MNNSEERIYEMQNNKLRKHKIEYQKSELRVDKTQIHSHNVSMPMSIEIGINF
jgi:hypothetical protein